MAEEKQFRVIRKMINAGMYDEARSALMGMDSPKADQWLRKLNQISPPKTRQQPRRQQPVREQRKPKPTVDDFYADELPEKPKPTGNNTAASKVVVIAVMLGIVVLLAGGAFMLTQTGTLEPPITTDETGCGAQAWVNEIDGSFNDLYRYNLWDMLYFDQNDVLILDEDLRQKNITELENRLARLENSSPPDCVVDVRNTMVEAYEAQITATKILDIYNPLRAFGLFGRTLILMKDAGTELVDLGAQFRRVDGAAIKQVVNPDCPAFEYVTRIMYVDNQFVVMLLVDPEITRMDQLQSFVNDLAQQYYRAKDDPTVPACLWEVRNSFVEMVDGMKSAFEAITGFDLYGFETHYARFETALDEFYIEVEKVGLDPKQFGG